MSEYFELKWCIGQATPGTWDSRRNLLHYHVRMSTRRTPNPHSKAVRHLARRCPTMKELIARVGPCTWAPKLDDPFTLIVHCVISQQISGEAAASIYEKLVT